MAQAPESSASTAGEHLFTEAAASTSKHHRLQQLATSGVIIAGRHRLDHLRLRLALDQRMITVRHLLVLLVRHGMIINSHRLLDLTPSTMQVMLKINVVKMTLSSIYGVYR
jgi:hypothetical protein